MSNLKDHIYRPLCRTLSPSNPLATDGNIKDIHLNTTTGEHFTKVSDLTWKGTQGTVVGGDILSPSHSNLAVMYTMDNISGSTLIDESIVGVNGDLINGPTTGAGVIGNAIFTDPLSSQYVDISAALPEILLTTQGAVCYWADGSVSSGERHTIGYATLGGGDYIQLMTESGNSIEYHREVSGSTITRLHSTTTVPLSGWYFVVVQSTGSAIEMWINGVQSSITTVTGTNDGFWYGDSTFTTQTLEIGRYNRGPGGPFYTRTNIDQLRIFNRALTQEEITALYNEGL